MSVMTNQNPLLTKLFQRNEVQCSHNNKGYCRFKERCFFQHFTVSCTQKFCKDKDCRFRHPKPCKFGNECTFYKKKICAFKHDENHGELERVKREISIFENEVSRLRAEISDLREIVKTKEEDTAAISKSEEAKSAIISEIIQENDALKTIIKESKDEIRNLKEELLREKSIVKANVACGKCDKTYISESKLAIHLKFDHINSDEIGFLCQNCPFVFPTKEEYTVHLSGVEHNSRGSERVDNTDSEFEDESDDEDFIDDCGFCGRILHSYDALDYHQANNIRCETCHVCFHNEFQWKYHENCDI